MAPYRRFWALPDVPLTLIITFFARMPVGMMGLAMVMYLREALGSFELAGSVLGVYFVAMAVAAPVVGRVIDRIGPTKPLWVAGVMAPVSFAIFIAVVWWRLPIAAMFAAVIAMGIFSPPITVLTRTLWRHRFKGDDERRMAFAIDSVLMEINFTLGPALIGLLLVFASPYAAVLVAWAALVFSILAFARSPALKYWQQEEAGERHWLGPLTDARLLLVFFLAMGLTTACGLLEVGYPAYATAMAVPAAAGLLLALNSLGSAVGGAVFGVMHLRLSLEKQFAMLLATFGLLLFVHLAFDAIPLFAIVAFFAGCAIAPAFAAQSLLVSRMAPARYATEAFTWASTFIVSGLGAGMALAGVLSEKIHVKAPFVAGGVVMLVCAGLALLALDTRAARNR